MAIKEDVEHLESAPVREQRWLLQGAEISRQGVSYRTWASTVQRVDVEILECAAWDPAKPAPRAPAELPPCEIRRVIPMRQREDGWFEVLDLDGQAGDLYRYRLDGGVSYPDPASRRQPLGVHGPSMVVDPRPYRWSDAGWIRHQMRDLVVYELHIGTFTREGTFRSAIERLGHVRDCGATAIELMPIADFAGERNWGYDGVYIYAPARAYGEPDDLRALVDAAHATGLTVLLDVVYNHFGPDGNYLAAYVGGYLDEDAKTPWGGAIRYGNPEFKALRELVVANPAFWMREYHFDGFRFDAIHAIFDESPRHILQEMTDSIHDHGGLAIAEDPRNLAMVVTPEREGGYGFDAVWADDFHHTARVANTGECESYLADFCGTLSELVETLKNGWFYRGQLSSRLGKSRGTKCHHLLPEQFVYCISNHDQTGNNAFGARISSGISTEAYRAMSMLLCLSPYTPLLFMGQEWGASTPFQFFTNHNEELGRLITEGRREEFRDFADFKDPEKRSRIPDPQSAQTFRNSQLDWHEIAQSPHSQILALYRACLALRCAEDAFRPEDRSAWRAEELNCGIGVLHLSSPAADWMLLFDLVGGHSGDLTSEDSCRIPSERKWTLALSSNDAAFGGSGSGILHTEPLQVQFSAAECALLKA